MFGVATARELEFGSRIAVGAMALVASAADVRCWRPLVDGTHGLVCALAEALPRTLHLHRAHQLGVVEAGSGIVAADGARWAVRAGDVVYHAPAQLHVAATDGAWRYRTFVFDDALLRRSGADRVLPATTTVVRHAGAAARLVDIHRYLERGAVTDAVATQVIEPFVDAAAGRAVRVPPQQPVTATIERCLHLLRADYARRVTLDELARLSGLSKFHLVRVFARAVGVAPHAYQIRLRLAHALSSHAARGSGTRAAYDVGFADQSHYVRVCRRLLGVTPAQALALEQTLPITADGAAQLPAGDRAAITRL